MASPKIMTTRVAFGTEIHKVDTIEHDGKLWLVPHWLDMPAEGVTMPSQIIRLDSLQGTHRGAGKQADSTEGRLATGYGHRTSQDEVNENDKKKERRTAAAKTPW